MHALLRPRRKAPAAACSNVAQPLPTGYALATDLLADHPWNANGLAPNHTECPGPRGRRARRGRRNTYFSGSERSRKRPSTQTAPTAPQTQTDAAGRVAGPGRGDFRGRASGLEGSTNVRTRGAQPQSGAQGAGPATRSKARPRHPPRARRTKQRHKLPSTRQRNQAAPQTTRHASKELINVASHPARHKNKTPSRYQACVRKTTHRHITRHAPEKQKRRAHESPAHRPGMNNAARTPWQAAYGGMLPRVEPLFPVSAENTQQHQQIRKDVVQIQINRQRRRHIIRFTAIDDALQIHQQQGRENRDRHH